MNCLSARRIMTTEPGDQSHEFIRHIEACASCKSYYHRQLKFNSVLNNAVSVQVPEGLAERILVQHRFTRKKEGEQKKYSLGAIAASIALVFVLMAVTTLQSPPAIANVILEHVHGEMWLLDANGHVTHASLNQLLKPHGVRADQEIGRAMHAGNCVIEDKLGVHIVFAGKNAPVTLIIFPEQLTHSQTVRIRDQVFHGVLMNTKKGTIALVSKDRESLDLFQERLKTSLMTFI